MYQTPALSPNHGRVRASIGALRLLLPEGPEENVVKFGQNVTKRFGVCKNLC